MAHFETQSEPSLIFALRSRYAPMLTHCHSITLRFRCGHAIAYAFGGAAPVFKERGANFFG